MTQENAAPHGERRFARSPARPEMALLGLLLVLAVGMLGLGCAYGLHRHRLMLPSPEDFIALFFPDVAGKDGDLRFDRGFRTPRNLQDGVSIRGLFTAMFAREWLVAKGIFWQVLAPGERGSALFLAVWAACSWPLIAFVAAAITRLRQTGQPLQEATRYVRRRYGAFFLHPVLPFLLAACGVGLNGLCGLLCRKAWVAGLLFPVSLALGGLAAALALLGLAGVWFMPAALMAELGPIATWRGVLRGLWRHGQQAAVGALCLAVKLAGALVAGVIFCSLTVNAALWSLWFALGPEFDYIMSFLRWGTGVYNRLGQQVFSPVQLLAAHVVILLAAAPYVLLAGLLVSMFFCGLSDLTSGITSDGQTENRG
ncbi:MAG: hypothetical protein FJ272_03015 [Planctomycetes bacterium]|nr:hypothetical protein [Planctomycetota bacterium]